MRPIKVPKLKANVPKPTPKLKANVQKPTPKLSKGSVNGLSLTIKLPKGKSTLTLPLNDGINTITWGDGKNTANYSSEEGFPIHTYTTTASKNVTVVIAGTFTSFGSYDSTVYTGANLIVSVNSWSGIIENLSYAFANATQLDRRAFQTGTKSKREWESIIPKTINYLPSSMLYEQIIR